MDGKLSGTDGSITYDRGSDGVVIPGSYRNKHDAVNGSTIQLTIDDDIQYYVQQQVQLAKDASGAKNVSAVVLDAKSGEVLAMSNDNTFDPSQDIGAAKRLIESTAKIVIDRTGGNHKRFRKVPELVDQAMKSVDALPATKHRRVQELMGSLREAVFAVNRLRNEAGDGHGEVAAATGIDDRDGRLAARVAIAWCAYVLDCLGDLPAHSSAD